MSTYSVYKIPMIVWTDNREYGPPDEEGRYLCAFSKCGKPYDIETLDYSEGDINYWREPRFGLFVTHWAELPDHPEESA